ncbi:aminotransferase class III-fold pyridoxal phosphate-dependent enzyme [Bradyrhizobium sp. SSUT77]|uniref:aspartate aminotransferase family protein n=1 Tax=Bradyrhizobium sp. SSUT77 TaxID=3040603 RepID=UPI00244C8408|nr:aminotransferase class III-fold pyridoxal phosphate-dependent enzyme [Bradyrhizobium sp. SSUT77]MDH2348967.1 aminotransferase class III-fold pyridoxal phosphate-dependent enzyme [Bradyrhizobium sp. SSUT77]
MDDIKHNLDLALALTDAEERYSRQHLLSRAHMERASRFMPGGNTRSVLFFKPFPLVVKASSGCRVQDLEGNDYVDFLGEYSAGLFGHSEPTIKAALQQAIETGWVHGGHIENEAHLAASLCSRFPSVESIRFTNSGTEANLMALVTARAFTKRSRIMAFRGGYHGGVLLYKSGDSVQNAPFPLVLCTYNNIEQTVAAIDREARDLAAVIVEPLQGSAGCIPASREFLSAIRVACERHGVILIFDEVMCSRLAPGGLQGALEITPDLTTLGKYLGGGASFGAFGGRGDIMSLYDPNRPDALAHAGTFNNNAISMAAAVAAAKVLTSERLMHLNAMGDALRARLTGIAHAHALPIQFTGGGSMMNIHFREGDIRTIADTETEDPNAKPFFHLEMLARGQYLARRGMLTLSLPMTANELDGFASAFEDFLELNGRLIAASYTH